MNDQIDPYCDPETGVLKNILRLDDSARLEQAERDLVELRDVSLKRKPLLGQYDLEHLKAFHWWLFQDVYEWAGQLRSVDIVKDSAYFCRFGLIEGQATDIFTALGEESPLSKDIDAAGDRLAFHLGEINALHPFREGNGRAQRAFIWQYARDGGWNIDWTYIDPEENRAACWEAMSGSHQNLRRLIVSVLSPLIASPPA